MEDAPVKVSCISLGMEMLHRWIAELEGHKRTYAFELMNLVMAGELTNDEAFSLLDNAPHQGTPIP